MRLQFCCYGALNKNLSEDILLDFKNGLWHSLLVFVGYLCLSLLVISIALAMLF